MKYVMMMTAEGKKFPIIFPDDLVHEEVAKAMANYDDPAFFFTATPNAGDIEMDVVHVGGKSTSLRVESGAEDELLISYADYTHGDPSMVELVKPSLKMLRVQRLRQHLLDLAEEDLVSFVTLVEGALEEATAKQSDGKSDV